MTKVTIVKASRPYPCDAVGCDETIERGEEHYFSREHVHGITTAGPFTLPTDRLVSVRTHLRCHAREIIVPQAVIKL